VTSGEINSANPNRPAIPIGLVFSRTGSYRTIGEELLNGALLAIEEVNETPGIEFRFVPKIEDPGGDFTEYRVRCEALLRNNSVRHIVGCYTSSSRKEVIPAFEKLDALLWYPSHYEGFESCNNVIYTGAAPNQHIVPLIEYVLGHFGDRAYCVGSNYIWAWENNRIMRETVLACRGSIVAEKYLPVGSTDIEHLIKEIADTKPSFIFNTLIGESSYAFLRAFHEAGKIDKALRPASMPITSCTLSEPELLSVGGQAACGHIASSVYFQSKDRPENRTFVSRFKARFGEARVTSADAEASYIAVTLLARAIQKSGSTDVEQVKQAVYACELEAPQGPVRIDPENNHSYLTPLLGRSTAEGQYEVIWTADKPVKPDPYLVHFDVRQLSQSTGRDGVGTIRPPQPHLRVVT